MRIAWRTVGAICERVASEAERDVDLLVGLRRAGIDEISHRTGQRYLTVLVDHDTGRLLWAAAGRDRKTVDAFLDALGEERCKQLASASPISALRYPTDTTHANVRAPEYQAVAAGHRALGTFRH
jgi:transposase